MFVRDLPEDSLIFLEAYGQAHAWSRMEHRAVDILDMLRGLSWQLAGDANAERPKPIERPRDPEPEASAKPFDPHELVAFMGAPPVIATTA